MKIFKWFILILFFSCIDVITQNSFYHSLYFQGGSWMEIAIMDSMKIGTDSNDYTLQFWVSGIEVDTNEAPAFFSLIDPIDKEDVIKAHRLLMQKIHPDRGGSDYLAKKINLAKDFLINELHESN